jgi:acetyl-CoA C-acetyltransferase
MFIKGVSHSKFGATDRSTTEMGYDVAIDAIKNSGLTLNDIGIIVVTDTMFESNGEHQRHTPALYAELFQTNIPIIRVPAACAGGSAALYTANRMGGKYVLVIAADKMKSSTTSDMTEALAYAGERYDEQDEGLNFPAQNALIANQFMKLREISIDDLHLIAKKNYDFAKTNKYAFFYGKNISLEQIKNSPMVSSPLQLHHCSVSVDGACAVVLSQEKTDIEIVGSSLITTPMSFFAREKPLSLDGLKKAASEAYSQAQVTPDQIDVAEVHDAFSTLEIMAYEDLGFCKEGEGKFMIRNGDTNLNGKTPINTSGGLKAKGHPISTTGLSQVVWLTKQLRGQCGENQVNDAKIALAHNLGGVGATSCVHILKKIN